MNDVNSKGDLQPRLKDLSEKKKKLLEQILATGTVSIKTEQRPPSTNVERKLLAIWRKVFLDEKVGVDDNYFSLGGDSLTSIKITSLAKSEAINVVMQDLIKFPTISQLASELESREGTLRENSEWIGKTKSEQSDDKVDISLTPNQAGILYHVKEMPESSLYISQFSCDIDGMFDTTKFEQSINIVLAEFPGLRAKFESEALAKNKFGIQNEVNLSIKSLEVPTCISYREYISEVAKEEFSKGFNIADAPLMRFVIIKYDSSKHHCLWTHHHLILDGWSQQIVLSRLFAVYSLLEKGLFVKPVERLNPYLEYSRKDKERESAYWSECFTGYRQREKTFISADGRAASEVSKVSYQGEKKSSEELVSESDFACDFSYSELSASNRQVNFTINSMVAATVNIAMTIVNQSMQQMIGTIFSGRKNATLDTLEEGVGNLINCLPFWIKYNGELRFIDLCEAVQNRMDAHQDFESSGMNEISRYSSQSDLPNEIELLYVYENFITHDELMGREKESKLGLSNFNFNIIEHYPIVLVVQQSSGSLLFKLKLHEGKVNLVKVNHFWRVFKLLIDSKVWQKSEWTIQELVNKTNSLDLSRKLSQSKRQFEKIV